MTRPQKIALGCIGSALVFLVFVGSIIWRHTDIGDAQATYDDNLANYRKSGMPWTAEALAPKPPVEDKENAAIPTWHSMQKASKIRTFERDCKQVYSLATSLKIKEAKKQIELLRAFVDDAREIAEKPKFDFRHDWDLGPSIRFDECRHLKHCSYLLAVSAVISASNGETRNALNDIARLNRLSDHAGMSPCLVSLLVRISIHLMRTRVIEILCNIWRDDAERLNSLLKITNESMRPFDFKYYVRGEAYLGLATMRNIDRTKNIEAFLLANPENPTKAIRVPFVVRSGEPKGWKVKIMMSRFYQSWSYFAKLAKEINEPIGLSRKMDQYVESPQSKRLSYVWTSIVLPVFSAAGTSIVRAEASYATVRALTKIQLYRAKIGRYPKTLAEARISEIDPFTTRPLLYRAVADGCRVYSVGEDLKDNGGKRRHEVKGVIKNKAGYDIVASYPAYRPKK